MSKSYVGLCGSCKYCDLGDKYTFCYSTSFKCTERNTYVKADEKSCNKFEPDTNRTNEIIDKYTR